MLDHQNFNPKHILSIHCFSYWVTVIYDTDPSCWPVTRPCGFDAPAGTKAPRLFGEDKGLFDEA